MQAPILDLYTAQSCPHCADMKKLLDEFTKENRIQQVHVFDIAQHPLPDTLNFIRSVPVTLISGLPFVGNYNHSEISHWLEFNAANTLAENYIQQNLVDGKLDFLIALFKQQPELLQHVIPLLQNDETSMQVRIGITAIIEEFSASPALDKLIPALKKLAEHDNINTATDAVYYLSLTQNPALRDFFTHCLQQDNSEIKSIAEEFLAEY